MEYLQHKYRNKGAHDGVLRDAGLDFLLAGNVIGHKISNALEDIEEDKHFSAPSPSPVQQEGPAAFHPKEKC